MKIYEVTLTYTQHTVTRTIKANDLDDLYRRAFLLYPTARLVGPSAIRMISTAR